MADGWNGRLHCKLLRVDFGATHYETLYCIGTGTFAKRCASTLVLLLNLILNRGIIRKMTIHDSLDGRLL